MSGHYPTIEEMIKDIDLSQEIQPVKVTLPASQAAELLRLLAIYEGIARDQLMPTFDNIAYVAKQRYEMDLGQ
jgi:hypothetical protein